MLPPCRYPHLRIVRNVRGSHPLEKRVLACLSKGAVGGKSGRRGLKDVAEKEGGAGGSALITVDQNLLTSRRDKGMCWETTMSQTGGEGRVLGQEELG